MIFVYTDKDSPRLQFVLRHILVRILGGQYLTTENREEYLNSSEPGICYSTEYIGRGVWVERKKEDPFMWAFSLLAREEELLGPFDLHGRYVPEASSLSKEGLLERPVIDEYAMQLRTQLLSEYPRYLGLPGRKAKVILTHDIDHPFLYRNKGFLLTLYGVMRETVKGDFSALKSRLMTLFYLKEDPYFCFENLFSLYKGGNLNPKFFIHVGPYGRCDRKYLYPSFRYRKIVKELAKQHEVGLHPSYASGSKSEQIRIEKTKLERWIASKPIVESRQHYLCFRIPETPRALLASGIAHDYSLGYSTRVGFRAGTSVPFPYYDLEREEETALILHPLIVMDVTLQRDLQLSPESAEKKIKQLWENTKAVGGDFTLLFHNSSLAESAGWEGWSKMYERVVHYLQMEQA
ncbi:MAG: polysaccharide deacetylase family protein [Bacteroidaceae bacterium]